MDDSYHSENQDDPFEHLDAELDEYLCEYVDGSMDPVVRGAFEEYLASNPRLAEHVSCLCAARSMLTKHRQCPHAAKSIQQRLHTAIAHDQLGDTEPAYPRTFVRLGTAASITAAVGLMLMLGVLFGTTVIANQPPPVATGQPLERMGAPSDAHQQQFTPVRQSFVRRAHTTFPATALPVLASSRALTPVDWSDSTRTVGAR